MYARTSTAAASSAKDLAQRLSAGREGGGIMRGVEFGVAGLVLLLLFGYLAAERVTCL